MIEKTNIEKIKKELKKGRLSKTEIGSRIGIHPYLLPLYLDALLKNNIIIEEKNKSGKYTYYKLK